MESDLKFLLEALDTQEVEAKENYYSKIEFVRNKLNATLLDGWNIVKEEELLTKSIIRRLEGYYLSEYKIKKVRGKGTIGMGIGDYFEDLIVDTLRRYLQLVFKKESGSGVLQIFCGKRIKNRIPDVIIQITNVPIIALEVKVNFGRKQLKSVKANYDIFSKEGIKYFVVAAGVPEELFSEEECEDILMGPDEAKKLNWVYALGLWEKTREWKIETFKVNRLNSIEPLFDRIQSTISIALQK